MTILIRYRCNNCGNRFKTEVLEPHEKQEYIREGRPFYNVHCPECNRTDIRRGWD